MTGHMDGSVLNDDSARPVSGSRTPAVRARSSSPGGTLTDRTRVLEVIPSTPPKGQVGIIPGTVGVANVAVAQLLCHNAILVCFPAGSGWSV